VQLTDPNSKPWRIWYSADDCQSWRRSRASFGTLRRAVDMGMKEVGPRLVRQHGASQLAICAIHAGTNVHSAVFTIRPETAAKAAVESPVIVQIYHGASRPMTLVFGYVSKAELDRRRKSGAGSLVIRRFCGVANTASVEQAALGAPARVVTGESTYLKLRDMTICKIAICTAEAAHEWERRKKLKAVRDAIDLLDCTNEERAELVEILYEEDLGTRIDTESAEQIAAERLVWLRKETT